MRQDADQSRLSPTAARRIAPKPISATWGGWITPRHLVGAEVAEAGHGRIAQTRSSPRAAQRARRGRGRRRSRRSARSELSRTCSAVGVVERGGDEPAAAERERDAEVDPLGLTVRAAVGQEAVDDAGSRRRRGRRPRAAVPPGWRARRGSCCALCSREARRAPSAGRCAARGGSGISRLERAISVAQSPCASRRARSTAAAVRRARAPARGRRSPRCAVPAARSTSARVTARACGRCRVNRCRVDPELAPRPGAPAGRRACGLSRRGSPAGRRELRPGAGGRRRDGDGAAGWAGGGGRGPAGAPPALVGVGAGACRVRGGLGGRRRRRRRQPRPRRRSSTSRAPRRPARACRRLDQQLADYAVLEDLDLDLGLAGVDRRRRRHRGGRGHRRRRTTRSACRRPCRRRARACGTQPPRPTVLRARLRRSPRGWQRRLLELLGVGDRHLGAADALEPARRARRTPPRRRGRRPRRRSSRCATPRRRRRRGACGRPRRGPPRRRAAAARAGRAPRRRPPRAPAPRPAASAFGSEPP